VSLAEDLRAALLEGADPAVAAAQSAYHKGVLEHRGWKGPQVEALFKQTVPALDALSPSARLDVGLSLLDSPVAEEQSLGGLVLSREKKRLPVDTVARIEPIFDRRTLGWATCDLICGRVLRWRLPDPAERARLDAWSAHPSPWRRRAACVAHVNEARKGLYGEEIDRAVRGALALDHRFSQLGAGWVLRERWLAAPAEVEAFLSVQGPLMRREALRYAIEKMPPALQQRFLHLPS
jgi:3-methyladenine DNA glycosylase AlkD